MSLPQSFLALVAILGLTAGFASAQSQSAPQQPLPPATLQELLQKQNAIQDSVAALTKKMEDTKGWTTKDVLTSIGGLAAVLLAVINVWVALRVSRRTLTMSANEKAAAHIQEKLDKFYGPLMQLLNQSRLLYKAFKAKQVDPEKFRTLSALLYGKKFQGNEKALLDAIIEIGKETETLIKSSSGLVDADIQPVLGQATTHYLVLRLAHTELLQGDADKFAEYVFPLDLEEMIQKKIEQLKGELKKLRTVH